MAELNMPLTDSLFSHKKPNTIHMYSTSRLFSTVEVGGGGMAIMSTMDGYNVCCEGYPDYDGSGQHS